MIRSNRWSKVLPDSIHEKFYGFTGVMNSGKCDKIIKDGNAVWGFSLNDWYRDNGI